MRASVPRSSSLARCTDQHPGLVAALAQMAQALSKEEYLTPPRLMECIHWRTLIEEGCLPTVPRWRGILRDLRFWERLVTQTLCRFARKAASQWIHLSTELSTEQRHRLFWRQIERGDPKCETPVGPRAHPYTVEAFAPARLSPPVRKRPYVHQLAALHLFTFSQSAITLLCAEKMMANVAQRLTPTYHDHKRQQHYDIALPRTY